MRAGLTILLLILSAAAAAGGPVYAFNSGSLNEYTDLQGNLFEADRAYVPGDAGFLSGSVQEPPYVPNISPWTSLDHPLHTQQIRHCDGYRFDLPNGDYLVRLYFFEGSRHGPRLRVFHVDLEGVRVLENFDLCERVGFMSAYERSFLTTVQDGCLDLDMTPVRYETMLSAVAVWSVSDPGSPPDAPDEVSVEAGFGNNVLRWSVDWKPTVGEVLVYRAESEEGPWDLAGSTPFNRAFYVDYGADEGDDCFYRLAARDVWGRESEPSPTLSASTMTAADTGLPVLRINIGQADYDSLNAWPHTDTYYPVGWAFDDDWFQQGEGRYRGGLARFFEKKPWKVKPGVDDAFEDYDALLMVSNPDDPYVIRNHVSMEIFGLLTQVWNPEVHWASLMLNGEYRGVYDLTEPVDADFLIKRGETAVGNLYKAYSIMAPMASLDHYRYYYEYKAGDDQSYDDLVALIEGIDQMDDYDIGPFVADRVDLPNFYDYYSHMIYTRQYDFLERNYYLYHSPRTGLWSLIPWDLTLSFWPDALPLDFGTESSPHFWDGSWNHYFDRLLSIPRVRWDYASRLEQLNAGQLNGARLDAQVWNSFAEVQAAGQVDPFRPWFATGDYFDIAGSYVDYRINQRDEQLLTMLPAFKDEIPTLSINEVFVDPEGLENPWVELHNYGDDDVMLVGGYLKTDGPVYLPATHIAAGGFAVFVLDEGGVPGSVLSPEGGTLELVDMGGRVHDQVRFGPAQAGYTQGHVPDGWINWKSMAPTRGSANQKLELPALQLAAMEPAQPLQGDSLHLSVRTAKHELPLELRVWFSLGDSLWSAELLPQDEDATEWFAQTAPVGRGGILHWWVEAADSVGMRDVLPAGAPEYFFSTVVMGGAYAIFVNELMADNETTIADEAGDYEDWIELHNAGADTVNLAGYLLTDDSEIIDPWIFPEDPASVIPPGGYILVWCDEEAEQGPLHANFRLDRDGEAVGFFRPDSLPVNIVDFGSQDEDRSYGRVVDADPVWVTQIIATPGFANAGGTGTGADPAPVPLSLAAAPNPFNPRVRLSLRLPEDGPVDLSIFDVRGRRVRTLARGEMRAGSWSFEWTGIDERGRRCASGVYLARLSSARSARSVKLVLLK